MKIRNTIKVKHDSKNTITAQLIVILKTPYFTDRTAKIVNENQLVKIHSNPTDLLLNDFNL